MTKGKETGSDSDTGQDAEKNWALNILHSELARRKYGTGKTNTFSDLSTEDLQQIVKSPEGIEIKKAADGSPVGFEIKKVK